MNKPIYKVRHRFVYNKFWWCATAEEAAKRTVDSLSTPEKKAITVENLVPAIKAMTKNQDLTLFGVEIEKETLFG
jgi:hypothetical protein